MKLFSTKAKKEEPDGYTLLLQDLSKTTEDLRVTYDNLQNVVDPDLIDCYIY